MKIVYFYQYFTTPKGAYGTRVYEFTKQWVEAGHDVTVVTSIYEKSDLRASKFLETQVIDGIKLKIINVRIDNKQSTAKRMYTFLLYSLLSIYYALTLKCDVVISSSGPITVGIPGIIAKVFRRKVLVFEVRDLWPEVAIELGVVKNKLIKVASYWFEKQCYKASTLIVGLSPGMKADIERRYGHKNVISITNAANIELFSSKKKLNREDLEVRKYAIYTGNIGKVNNSYWLFNAAKRLQDLGRGDIKIILIGDGQQRAELEALAIKEKVDNFLVLKPVPKKDLVSYVQNAMVSLVPLKGNPILNTSSPNKFFESLAAGVPVIQNTTGWMKDFLNKNGVGFTVDPDDANELADLLIDLDNKSDFLQEMGNKGATIAKKEFDKNILSLRMLKAIEDVAAK